MRILAWGSTLELTALNSRGDCAGSGHRFPDQDLEHAISPQLEQRLQEILGNPKVCPHGNPFPGYEHVVSKWVPLTEVTVGAEVTVRRIHEFAEDNHELLEFLTENGLTPSAKVTLTEILPFNQTLTLRVDRKTVTLGFPAARLVFVER